jgi:hypothetical protein
MPFIGGFQSNTETNRGHPVNYLSYPVSISRVQKYDAVEETCIKPLSIYKH